MRDKNGVPGVDANNESLVATAIVVISENLHDCSATLNLNAVGMAPECMSQGRLSLFRSCRRTLRRLGMLPTDNLEKRDGTKNEGRENHLAHRLRHLTRKATRIAASPSQALAGEVQLVL